MTDIIAFVGSCDTLEEIGAAEPGFDRGTEEGGDALWTNVPSVSALHLGNHRTYIFFSDSFLHLFPLNRMPRSSHYRSSQNDVVIQAPQHPYVSRTESWVIQDLKVTRIKGMYIEY